MCCAACTVCLLRCQRHCCQLPLVGPLLSAPIVHLAMPRRQGCPRGAPGEQRTTAAVLCGELCCQPSDVLFAIVLSAMQQRQGQPRGAPGQQRMNPAARAEERRQQAEAASYNMAAPPTVRHLFARQTAWQCAFGSISLPAVARRRRLRPLRPLLVVDLGHILLRLGCVGAWQGGAAASKMLLQARCSCVG